MTRFARVTAVAACIFGVLAALSGSGFATRAIVSPDSAKLIREVNKIDRMARAATSLADYTDRDPLKAEYDIRQIVKLLNESDRFANINAKDSPSHPLVKIRELIQVPPEETVRQRRHRMVKISKLSTPMKKTCLTAEEIEIDQRRKCLCILLLLTCCCLLVATFAKTVF